MPGSIAQPRLRLLSAIALMAVAVIAHAATAQALLPESRPQAGGWTLLGGVSNDTSAEHVAAMARFGDTLYLGGDFTGLGRRTPGLAAFDTASGALAGPANDLDRHPNAVASPLAAIAVSAITPAPDGGLYVAGVFGGAGGTEQGRLLRLAPDGTLDAAFAPEVDFGDIGSAKAITAMAVSADGNRLYLAGDFAKVGGQSRTQLAAVDAHTGAVTGWQPSVAGGSVARLAIGDGALYLAGTFTTVGGAARKGVAAVSLSNGAPTAFDPQPNATGTVNDLAVAGSSVYVAGSFSTLQGAAHPLLAAVDPATGAPTAWNPQTSGFRITRIAASGNTLYLGGASFAINGGPLVSYGAVDRTTGAPVTWSPPLRKEPAALAADAGQVYVAFNGAPSPADGRCGAEAFAAAGTAGAGTATSWDPHLGLTAQTADVCGSFTMSALAVAGGKVWAGGTFDASNVAVRRGAAALNLTDDRLTSWAPEVLSAGGTAIVDALAVSPGGSTVYLGGRFSSVGGQARGNLAAVSAATAATPGTPVAGWANAANGTVRALAVNPQGTRVYVGGSFTALGQFGRLGIGSVSATTGGVSANFKPQATSASGAGATVQDLAVAPDGRVFAAGSFARIGFPTAVDRAGIAAIAGEATTADTGVATDWNAGLPAGTTVRTVALGDERVYAGGAAGAIDPTTSVGAFALDTGGRVPGFAAQVNRDTYRVSVDRGATAGAADDTIYLQGAFTRVTGPDGVEQVRRAAASLTADGAPTAWDPQPAAGVGDPAPTGVVALGDRLVLGGSFATLGNGAIRAVALGFYGPARAPTAGRPPSIDGTPTLGADLRCTPGRFGGSSGTSAWSWLRDGAPIDGESANTYTIRAADLGRALRCTQTVANTAGSASATSDPVPVAAPAPESATEPAVTGETWPGGTATCTTGLWRNSPTSFRYAWLLDGLPVAGADGDALRLDDGQRGHALACEVTAASAAGSATARSAPVTVTEPPPVSTSAPRVTGDPIVGSALRCDAGAWDGARTIAFAWLRDDAQLDGQSGPGYVATSKDLGHRIRCVVTAGNDAGLRATASAPVVIVPSSHTATFSRRPAIDDVGATGGVVAATVDVRSSALSRSLRTLVVRVSAPVAGRLTTTVTLGGRRLGRATTKVKDRSVVTVKVRLSAATAWRIRRAGATGLKVTVATTLIPAQGGVQRDRASTRLRTKTTKKGS